MSKYDYKYLSEAGRRLRGDKEQQEIDDRRECLAILSWLVLCLTSLALFAIIAFYKNH